MKLLVQEFAVAADQGLILGVLAFVKQEQVRLNRLVEIV